MNPVGELLRVEDVYLDLDVQDKTQLLRHVATLLSRRHGLSEAQVLESLISREQLGSTGLGHGVAIPHARMPQCYAAAGVFVRTKVPIDFDAPDHKPVSLVLGLIVPKQASGHHLLILATAAAMFGDGGFRGKLRTCTDAAAVTDLFAIWTDAATPNGSPIGEAPGMSGGNNSRG